MKIAIHIEMAMQRLITYNMFREECPDIEWDADLSNHEINQFAEASDLIRKNTKAQAPPTPATTPAPGEPNSTTAQPTTLTVTEISQEDALALEGASIRRQSRTGGIEKIIKHTWRSPPGAPGKTEAFFQVKWRGYALTSYEQLDTVIQDRKAITEYLNGLKKKGITLLVNRYEHLLQFLRE